MKNIPLLVGALVLFMSYRCSAVDNSTTAQEDRYIDYKLFEGVASNVAISLDFATKAVEAMDRMQSEGKDKLTTAFVGAKVSWLVNRPSKSILLLEDIVRKYGKERSGQGFNLPVSIVGNYWIATIARHFGDAERAQEAYDDILEETLGNETLMGQTVYCYLYKAELEAVMLKRKDLALETLGKIKKMHSPFGQGQEDAWNIFQEWADYQMATLTKGVSSAQSILKGSPLKIEVLKTVADAQLCILGITGSPRSDFYTGEKRILMKVYGLQQAIEIGDVPIDRSLSQAMLGHLCEVRNQPIKAEEYYTDLFNGGGFFAAEGGIFLADCQKRQGKIEDAKKTLSRIKERFPGYTKLVEDISAR